MEKTEQVIRMKFDGQLHQVDSNTFISSLIGLSEVIKQVNSEINPGTAVNIKINALEKGSFIAEIATIVMPALSMLPQIVSTADGTLGIVKGIYELRKFLKGEKPQSTVNFEGGVKIQDTKGNVYVTNQATFNIYNSNPTIHKAITGQFSALQEDPSVEGFHLLDKDNKEVFSAEKSEFNDLAVLKDSISEDKKIEQVVAELTISKLIFENSQTRKWEFYYKGNRISANMIDNDFFKRIDAGEQFAKGDRLRVELTIQKILDHSVNVYVIELYTVTKILEHVRRPEESSLFDSPSE